ncbi:2-octaprenyl-6-methoxyphenyl hydroxylase [Shewanella sp. A32]|uniref:2-octaprenyl-6-methoxyphenyl hydroxylase n=1 Tax=Shewanella sp. A32 TaxID=3031327 RepID=UPI0023BA231C|nr:2-octaprenyl-6-methoxyphenyl hydroxylase [Shewanella sp. A32]MDF0534020.1 2-octaprenyl-6-methoxyphenyl hydroxylase [Shewanella sp. A32]
MNPQSTEVDIAIVGGAMVGASLALALSNLSRTLQRPLKLALIEAHEPGQGQSGFDARAIAVAHGSRHALQQMGIWPKLANLGTPIRDIHVSDRGHFGMTEINSSSFNLDALGEVVELERVGQVLFAALAKTDIAVFCPSQLASIDSEVQGHTLTLNNGNKLYCKLLVAADGANSKVRQLQQQPQQISAFGQSAIIANVASNRPHQGMAWERFTEHGPIALLPMADSNGKPRLSLVWAMPEAAITERLTLTDSDFLEALQQAFGNRAGQFTAVGSRYSYPLALSYMSRPAFHRTVYLGNAAQTLHPIAGQGFNLGLRDISGLLAVLKPVLQQYADVGSVSVIHDYLACRETDRRQTINSIEFLVRGFSNQYWPLVVGRNLGLRLLSWIPPLKVPVAHRAMGWHGRDTCNALARSR